MIDTQEIAVTLRVPVEGESTRRGIATLVRGFGGSLRRKFSIYGCLNLHFNAFWARMQNVGFLMTRLIYT